MRSLATWCVSEAFVETDAAFLATALSDAGTTAVVAVVAGGKVRAPPCGAGVMCWAAR